MPANATSVAPTDAAKREAAWSGYWAHGSAHSCIGSYGDRYGGAIGQFWTSLFLQLRPGTRVLDLAAGNGALARLLLDARPQADFSCDAVDRASVAPTWIQALSKTQRDCLSFHGQTDISALPFDTQSFDLVVSQFGFEYAPSQSAIRELARVLKPGSPFALVVHHANSHVAQLASIESEQLRWLLDESDFFDCGLAMAEPMSRAATPEGRASLAVDANAEALRQRFNTVLADIAARAASSGIPDALLGARDAVVAVLGQSAAHGTQTCALAMQRLRAEHRHALARLEDMLEHALDQQGVSALCTQLQAQLHQEVVLGNLREGAHLMAWFLRSGPAANTPG